MDPRARAAQYYDANPVFPNDVPFYRQRIPSPQAKVLELGCGTGRVLVSLLDRCGYSTGLTIPKRCLRFAGRAAIKARRTEMGRSW